MQWHHGINDDDLRKIGEVLVYWSATDSFVANALNFLFNINDETLRLEIGTWNINKKFHLLQKSPSNHPQRELVDKICQHGLEWIQERNRVAHGLALLVDDQVFLEEPKRRARVGLSSLHTYLDHAQQVCNLALKLNTVLAAPWVGDASWFSEDSNS